MITPPNQPDGAKFFDLEMLVLLGSLERNEGEFRELFAASGFRLNRIIQTPGPHSIVEGTPV